MSEMAVEFKRRLFTVEEYHRLYDEGIFTERDRLELIEGELIEMPPIGQVHFGRHGRITRYLLEALRERVTVLPMGSFKLGPYSEPQPDLALFPYDEGGYENRPLPPPTEFVAFVEIADSSFAYDSKTKMRLYGRHGVNDYVVVDVRKNELIVFRDPIDAGYAKSNVFAYGDSFALSKIPDIVLSVDEFLAVR